MAKAKSKMLPSLQKMLDDATAKLVKIESESTEWQIRKYQNRVVLRCGCGAFIPYKFSTVCSLADTPCPSCKTELLFTTVLETAYALLQNAGVDLSDFDPPEYIVPANDD